MWPSNSDWLSRMLVGSSSGMPACRTHRIRPRYGDGDHGRSGDILTATAMERVLPQRGLSARPSNGRMCVGLVSGSLGSPVERKQVR